MKIESRKMAVISTAHITKEDANILESADIKHTKIPGLYYISEYGWGFIKIGDDDHRDKWKACGLSDDAFNNIKSVFDQGFDRVELDCDAEIVEGLKTFNW